MDDIGLNARSAPSAGMRDFKRLRLALIAAALCVAGLSVAASVTGAIDARRAALTQAQAKADGLVSSLTQHTIHGFHAVRAVLRIAAMEHAHRLEQGGDVAGMNATLAELTREVPVLRAMIILDRTGAVAADSRPAPAQPFDASDRAYFRVHRDDPGHGFFISEPVRGRVVEGWRFVASLRLQDARGEFLGVVIAALAPEQLAEIYRDQTPESALRATLYRDDGTVLARHPHDDRAIGEIPAEFAKLAPVAGETRTVSAALPLGERRTVHRAIEGLPLVVAVAFDSDEVLAPWRRSLGGYALWAAGAVAVTVVVMLLLLVMLHHRERASRAQATSERRLANLVASMSDWIWEQDAELRFTYIADHHLRRIGLDASKMLGKRREEIAADPDTEEMRRHREDLAARRAFRDLLVGRRLGDGRVAYFSISGYPLFDESGRFLGYRGTGRDVTDTKLAEMRAEAAAAEVQRSRDLLRAVLNNVPARIHLKDPDHRYLMVNDEQLRQWGVALGDVMGKRFEDVPVAEVDAAEHARRAAEMTARETAVMASGRAETFYQEAYSGAHAAMRTYLASKTPLFDESGKPNAILTVAMDITDIRKAERQAKTAAEELARSRDLLQAVLDTVPARISLKDPERRYMLMNRAHLDFWHLTPAEVLGRRLEEIPIPAMSPETYRAFSANVAEGDSRVLATGQAELMFSEDIAVDGRPAKNWLTSKVPLRDAGGAPNAILTVSVDVSDIKNAERQAKTAAEELARSRDLLQAVLDTVPALISVKDADRRFVLTNKAQVDAWNVTLDAVHGKRMDEIRIPSMSPDMLREFAASVDRRDRQVLETGRPILSHEDVLPGPDGEPVNWLSSKVPLSDAQGRTNGILSVAIDITAIKRAEIQVKAAADELKKNRDLLQAVLDNVPARVSVKDRDRRYVLVNKFGLESWGVTSEQAIGRRREEFHSRDASSHGRVADMVAKRDERVLETGEPQLFYEESWPGKDGVDKHHLVSKVPLRDDAGAVESVMTVSMDITPMKQAEKRAEAALAELKKNRDLLQAVLDTVPALINVKDRERRYIMMNKAHLNDYRLPLDAVLGKRLEDLRVPTIKPEEFPAFAANAAARDKELLEGAAAQINFEESFTTPDGRQVHWLTSKIPLGGADGAPFAILTASIDITDRKNAELKMGEANQRLADYAETSSDWLWETDTEHRFSMMSEGIRRVIGSDPALIIGKLRWEIALDRDDDPAKWAAHMEDLRAHRPFRDMVFHAGIGGKRIYISSSGKPVFDAEGRFTGYRGIGRDVTAEMRLKSALIEAKNAAEVASRAKSEFLANMSHELRTPLNAVIGFSDMLASGLAGSLHGKQGEYLRDIGASGRHLLDVINDVLDLAKIEAGRMDLREELFDVAGVVSDCTRLVRERARLGGIALEDRVAPGLRLRGDVLALKKILTNLLSNAVKFTPERGRVTIDAGVNAAGECVFTVADTGIGMSREEVATALEPFGQIDSAMTRRNQGTGLGLPLAVSLAEHMGGRLLIDSVRGTGTTVTVLLPAERVLHSAA